VLDISPHIHTGNIHTPVSPVSRAVVFTQCV